MATTSSESRPRSQKVVLDEEEYVKRLARIIRRDFFPGAPAVDTEETKWAHKKTGAKFKDEKLSVDKFQTLYTSEDNASFERLQERAIDLNKKRFPWLHRSIKDSSGILLLGDKLYTKDEESALAQESKKRKRVEYNSTRLRADNYHASKALSVASSSATEASEVVTMAENYRSFQMIDPSNREKLALQLGSKAQGYLSRRKKSRSVSKPNSRKNLSPAALRLAKRLLNKPSPKDD